MEPKRGGTVPNFSRSFIFPIHEHVSASRQTPNGMFLAQAPIFWGFLFFRYLNKKPRIYAGLLALLEGAELGFGGYGWI